MSPSATRLWAELNRILRFGMVGIVATAIHTGVALAMLPTVGSLFLANLVGFLVAFVFSFLGQALWTFQIRVGRRAAAMRFFVVSGGSFLFSNLVLTAAKASGILPDWAALVVAIAVIPVCNFIAARLWAFRPTT